MRQRERKCVWGALHEVRARESVFVGGWVGVFIYSEREEKRESVCVCWRVFLLEVRERAREKKEKVAKTARNFFFD